MTQYIVKARYTDHQHRSHYITEEVDLADRRYIEDFIRKLPSGDNTKIGETGVLISGFSTSLSNQ